MTYTKQRIADITGLSLRLVQFYTEEKLILPEKNKLKGRGYVRRYSKKSLLDFLIIKELGNYGITKKRISNVLKYIRTNQFTSDYSEHSFYKKGIYIFLLLRFTKNNKLGINFKMIGGAKDETPVFSIKELAGHFSYLIIDFGALVQKANQE